MSTDTQTPSSLSCRVLVVGGGPGGYVCAIRAGQLGLDTILVDAGGLGGTCLNRGCIPSKAMIHAADRFAQMTSHAQGASMGIALPQTPTLDLGQTVTWKNGIVHQLNTGVGQLLKKAGVRVVGGHARFHNAKTCTVDTKGAPIDITADHVVLATGSVPADLPDMAFGGNILSSTDALDLTRLPRSMIVVGGGYIGLELGTVFAKFGTRVTVLEMGARLLPQFDDELSRPVARWLKKAGVDVHLSTRLAAVDDDGETVTAHISDAGGAKDGPDTTLTAEKLLIATGRRPSTAGWGLENMVVDMDGPFIRVDDRCRTSTKNVWAIGDLTGDPMLAHKATAQGEMVADLIAGNTRTFDPRAIPAVCFTEPEIVSVGLSPSQAEATGEQVVTGRFPLAANGRALSMGGGDTGGLVRVTARASDHLVLGIDAVGGHVSELAGEFALALEMGARLEDISGTIHAHPTLGEATMEASLGALGHALHIA